MFGYFVLYTQNYWLTERKKHFHVQNCPCWNYETRLSVRAPLCTARWSSDLEGKYSLLIVYYKKHVYGENKHNRTCSCTRKQKLLIQGNITALRYRNDVIRSIHFLHIRANLSMMLARDYASCHAARSTLVMCLANKVQTLR